MENRMTAARAICLALGIWLFVSAFLWPHGQGQFTNTWIVGALVVVFTVATAWAPEARYVNTILAIWLLISTWAMPTVRIATLWNNVVVSVALLIASLLPPAPRVRGTGAAPPRL